MKKSKRKESRLSKSEKKARKELLKAVFKWYTMPLPQGYAHLIHAIEDYKRSNGP